MTQARPSLSVIIPTRNRAALVTRAIESVMTQGYEPIDIVVVDDGSTDETRAAVTKYEDRVRYLYQENKERGAARNVGLAATDAELVVFLDSDDVMLPGHLVQLVSVISSRPDVAIAFSAAEFFDDETGRVFDVFPHRPVEGDAFLDSLVGNQMVIGSVIVRRALLDRVGWFDEDPEMAGMEDWELWMRCLGTSPVLHAPKATVRIHFHFANTVGDPVAMERATRCAARKIAEHPLNRQRLLPHRRKLKAAMWALIANDYLAAGDRRHALDRLWRGIRSDPSIALTGVWNRSALKVLLGARPIEALQRADRTRRMKQKGVHQAATSSRQGAVP